MYSNKFVLCILHNGHILEEKKDGTVPMPFGSEYSLRFRNKNDRRAVVKFTIDGEDASGDGFVIPKQSAIDIFRYDHKDAKFRFVDLKSEAAADFGKTDNVEGEKGVIEARFYLEKATPVLPVEHHHHHYYTPRTRPYNWQYPTPYWTNNQPTHFYNPPSKYDVTCEKSSNLGSTFGSSMPLSFDQNVESGDAQTCFDPVGKPPEWGARRGPRERLLRKSLKEGCTVEGGTSGQTFSKTNIELETDYVAMKMVLRGYAPDSVVEVVNTDVSHCTNCGAKRLRKSDKFCGSCGTKM